MAVLHKIRAYHPSTHALLVPEFDDFLGLSYTMVVGNAGLATIKLNGYHKLLDQLVDKAIIEIWRKIDSRPWELDFATIYRDESWTWEETTPYVELLAFGPLYLLATRVIDWAASTEGRSKFTSSQAAETVAKTLVDYNAGPNATEANGRGRDGTISGISVEADAGQGNVEPWYCHGKNLLKNLGELARVGGGDFDLVKTAVGSWEFRWYDGQLGDDLTSTLTFAMDRGNMAEPRYEYTRSAEATVAVVYGQGDDSNRERVTVTGTNYAADNDIEVYVDARNVEQGDTDGLSAKGQAKLRDMERAQSFTFDALQTATARFGVDYGLGALVTAVNPFNGDTVTRKVTRVTITREEDGSEKVTPTMEAP